MSSIYFHSPMWSARTSGLLWLDSIIDSFARGWFNDLTPSANLRLLLPPEALRHFSSYPEFSSPLGGAIVTWSTRGPKHDWLVDDVRYNCRQLNLNTAMILGGDIVKLCARLLGQCSAYGFIRDRNRAWLADIINRGVASGLLRSKDGWSNLVVQLKCREQGPVVITYENMPSFPDYRLTNVELLDWAKMSPQEQWSQGMMALRERSGDLTAELELTPDGWDEYRFGHGKDALWLLKQAYLAREPKQPNAGVRT